MNISGLRWKTTLSMWPPTGLNIYPGNDYKIFTTNIFIKNSIIFLSYTVGEKF